MQVSIYHSVILTVYNLNPKNLIKKFIVGTLVSTLSWYILTRYTGCLWVTLCNIRIPVLPQDYKRQKIILWRQDTNYLKTFTMICNKVFCTIFIINTYFLKSAKKPLYYGILIKVISDSICTIGIRHWEKSFTAIETKLFNLDNLVLKTLVWEQEMKESGAVCSNLYSLLESSF